jgi:hypothetical protein
MKFYYVRGFHADCALFGPKNHSQAIIVVASCSKANAQGRIVCGQEVDRDGKYPFIVHLKVKVNETHGGGCGKSILSKH